MTDIAEWLASLGPREHAPRFAENAIDPSIVGELRSRISQVTSPYQNTHL